MLHAIGIPYEILSNHHLLVGHDDDGHRRRLLLFLVHVKQLSIFFELVPNELLIVKLQFVDLIDLVHLALVIL